ncbi:MAG: 1-acyl-sn-glycerol-3-phosphate acyltransferase [Bacilli bacterium]|nr:1-acyl-sn-glycerol-3-phosphate acyltransferase [Bacilli bacterium]
MKKKIKDKTFIYCFFRPLFCFLFRLFFHPKFYGRENIPKKGRVILAGTHTSNFDCFLLGSSTKRPIHFLAKDELWRGFGKFIFGNMGLIPVNRRQKDSNALKFAEEYLNNECLIGIFPEGTTEKKYEVMLPFKIGAVKMAKDTKTTIVPFAIKGKYKLFGKSVKIKYGKPIIVKGDLEVENDHLKEIVSKLRKEL